MNHYVTDTMALVLFLEKRKMPEAVRRIFENATAGAATIVIPAMVLAEIGYLAERKRIGCTLESVQALCQNFEHFSICPLDFPIVQTAFQIGDIPELHDRLIAATAAQLGFPLLTNDPVIRASARVRTFWN